jgi:hypothetical protein
VAIKDNRKTIPSPYFIFGIFFRIFDLALYISTVCPVKISPQSSFYDLGKNPLPCKSEFHLAHRLPAIAAAATTAPKTTPGSAT